MEKLNKHMYISGNPLLHRKRVKLVLIDAIILKLKQEGITSIHGVCLSTGCFKQQARDIYCRRHDNIALKKLLVYCDRLKLTFSFNDLTR